MRVHLTAKLAEVVEGVDLSSYSEGDVIELKERDAQLLIAGHWAECVPFEERCRCTDAGRPRPLPPRLTDSKLTR